MACAPAEISTLIFLIEDESEIVTVAANCLTAFA
jgi:hypothetical protein